MAVLTPNPPLVFTGIQVALFLGPSNAQQEVPIIKGEFKIAAKKTESTGSTSIGPSPTTTKIWEEYGQGPSGWGFNWNGCWRIGQVLTPLSIVQGETYGMTAYARRPGWNGPADPGVGYTGALYIEDNSITLDPRSGIIEWKVTGSGQGTLTFPTSA
jgi:hypothetical protein